MFVERFKIPSVMYNCSFIPVMDFSVQYLRIKVKLIQKGL